MPKYGGSKGLAKKKVKRPITKEAFDEARPGIDPHKKSNATITDEERDCRRYGIVGDCEQCGAKGVPKKWRSHTSPITPRLEGKPAYIYICDNCLWLRNVEYYAKIPRSRVMGMYRSQRGKCAMCKNPPTDGGIRRTWLNPFPKDSTARHLVCHRCIIVLNMIRKSSGLERALGFMKEEAK